MKKLFKTLLSFGLVLNFLNALEIDANSASANVVGYKTATKIEVPMTFLDATFKFLNTTGNVDEILKGATATIKLSSVDTYKNPLRDKNLRDKFFAHINGSFATATINSVEGDDTKGILKTTITLNGVSKEVDMNYEVNNEKIIAKGVIDIQKDFNIKEAYDTFRNDKIIQGLHAKQTWAEVEIGFEVKLK